jgi:GNAT superfamily N-acetyltransferase
MMDAEVWQAADHECDEAAAVLARAFLEEPILRACFPPSILDVTFLTRRWTASLRYARRAGQVWVIGPSRSDIAGVAMVYREPVEAPSPNQRAELGYPDHPDVDAAVACMFDMISQAEAVFDEMPVPWRNLAMLGIAPDRQGQGLGSILLEHVLADAAAAGEPVGLVTSRERNLPFYRRAGLELCWSGTSADGAIALWSFRTPRTLRTPTVPS